MVGIAARFTALLLGVLDVRLAANGAMERAPAPSGGGHGGANLASVVVLSSGRLLRGAVLDVHGRLFVLERSTRTPGVDACRAAWNGDDCDSFGRSGRAAVAARAPPDATAMVLAVAAMLGIVFFYVYLAAAFGHWDLYHRAQFAGWSVVPDYLVFLRWDAYLPKYTNGVVCPILIVTAVVIARRQTRLPSESGQDRTLFWSLLVVAGLLFYLVMAAMINRQLCSLPRISYPSFVLVALAAAYQANGVRSTVPWSYPRVRWAMLAVAIVVCLALQIHFVQRFIHREWVA